VRQPVGFPVLSAGDVGYGEGFQRAGELDYFLVERPQSGFFNAVFTFELFDHQLRVRPDFNFSGAEAGCLLKGGDDSPVFRLVIGGVSDAPGNTADGLALPVPDNGADRGPSRVAR